MEMYKKFKILLTYFQIFKLGDNIMTAVSVSRDCGMVPSDEKIILLSHKFTTPENGARPSIHFEVVGEPRDLEQSQNYSHISLTISSTLVNEKYCFALDGKTWNVVRQHYPDLIPRILTKGIYMILTHFLCVYPILNYICIIGTVFGRFGPDQKTQLVVAFQQLNYIVGMCGDGANDCGALKAAHIGISLSQAEASGILHAPNRAFKLIISLLHIFPFYSGSTIHITSARYHMCEISCLRRKMCPQHVLCYIQIYGLIFFNSIFLCSDFVQCNIFFNIFI